MAKRGAARRTKRPLVQTYKGVTPYLTKDRSVIRELMHPGIHGAAAQSLAEAIIPGGLALYCTSTRSPKSCITSPAAAGS